MAKKKAPKKAAPKSSRAAKPSVKAQPAAASQTDAAALQKDLLDLHLQMTRILEKHGLTERAAATSLVTTSTSLFVLDWTPHICNVLCSTHQNDVVAEAPFVTAVCTDAGEVETPGKGQQILFRAGEMGASVAGGYQCTRRCGQICSKPK